MQLRNDRAERLGDARSRNGDKVTIDRAKSTVHHGRDRSPAWSRRYRLSGDAVGGIAEQDHRGGGGHEGLKRDLVDAIHTAAHQAASGQRHELGGVVIGGEAVDRAGRINLIEDADHRLILHESGEHSNIGLCGRDDFCSSDTRTRCIADQLQRCVDTTNALWVQCHDRKVRRLHLRDRIIGSEARTTDKDKVRIERDDCLNVGAGVVGNLRLRRERDGEAGAICDSNDALTKPELIERLQASGVSATMRCGFAAIVTESPASSVTVRG